MKLDLFRKRINWLRQWWPRQPWERRLAFIAFVCFAIAGDIFLTAGNLAALMEWSPSTLEALAKTYLAAFGFGAASMGAMVCLVPLCFVLPVIRRVM